KFASAHRGRWLASQDFLFLLQNSLHALALMLPASNQPAVASNAEFPRTLWSMVLLAGEEGSEPSREALATLCRAYWRPLYAFLRRQGKSPHDAEDLTQAFLAHLLENHRLSQVRKEKGKFRSFLLASLRNFLSDEWDK